MYRAFILQRKALVTGVAAAAATTGVTLATDPSQSTSPSPRVPVKEKLSIYSTPTPDVILLDTPSSIELRIGAVRRQVMQSYMNARGELQSVVNKWIGVEHAVETRVKSILSPEEEITPGFLYTGISTLTGSIIARNRSLPVRFFLPTTFFLLSFNHFLPKTASNLAAYLGSLEDVYAPGLAEKHRVANAHTAMAWDRFKEATKEAREKLSHGMENVIGKVQETTGLKVGDVMRKGREEVKEVVHDAAKEVLERAAEDVKNVDVGKKDG
ncbi:hypothetical protein AMATHDRAFT_68632 [Amanita thiersii Skay4041]|uniref:MICOS complex subunit n=1 Tax=Amanita thiersii Skay4041 TaxID=703135 RepID=A0A2A9NFC9_9AGAR|nr:hypothetical protein AMATHDRAFT_68632 [Amanita thiersii Skay4041]